MEGWKWSMFPEDGNSWNTVSRQHCWLYDLMDDLSGIVRYMATPISNIKRYRFKNESHSNAEDIPNRCDWREPSPLSRSNQWDSSAFLILWLKCSIFRFLVWLPSSFRTTINSIWRRLMTEFTTLVSLIALPLLGYLDKFGLQTKACFAISMIEFVHMIV